MVDAEDPSLSDGQKVNQYREKNRVEASPGEIIKARRWRNLVKSLASLRTAEKADVTLVCGGRDFPVHKIVLEASSPYFVSLFSRDFEASKRKMPVLAHVDPDILGKILDYIYLGEVNQIKSEEELKQVAKISKLMTLDDLCEYCCHGLAAFLTHENFFEIFEINQNYDIKKIKLKVLYFWIANATKLVASDAFLRLSAENVKELLNFLRCNHSRLDVVLVGLLRWLTHDLKTRELFVDELFACIDERLVSRNCITLLITDKDVLKSSANVVNKVFKLGAASSFYDDSASLSDARFKTTVCPWATTLTYFSDYRLTDVFDPSKNRYNKIVEKFRCVQQFDLTNMTWLPLKTNAIFQCCSSWNFVHMCQNGQRVYMIGGILGLNGYFDVQSNVYKPIVYSNLRSGPGTKMGYFKSHLYAVGWKMKSAVHYLKPGGNDWLEAQPLNYFQSISRILASSDHLYVIGEMTNGGLTIEYTDDPIKKNNEWKTIRIQKSGLEPSYFFVLHNTLNVLYFGDGILKHLAYDHKAKRIAIKGSFNTQKYQSKGQMWKPLPLSHFQNYESPFVFFSKPEDHLYIPAFVWEPVTNMWSVLPSHQEQCDIPNDSSVKMLYSVEKPYQTPSD